MPTQFPLPGTGMEADSGEPSSFLTVPGIVAVGVALLLAAVSVGFAIFNTVRDSAPVGDEFNIPVNRVGE